MGVLSCTAPFAYSEPNGVQRVLRVGDVVDETDPCVAGRESFFEPVEATVHRATDRTNSRYDGGIIEQATNAPGEKRARRKPGPKPKAAAGDEGGTSEP
jgi:hypothetical protein